ncbi:DUF2252 domain-containing protein [Hoyosella sp. G463]|uniref:DUF2252 domain-containing protein n=1 Tax=Lolliginicoccus lacisalsi TaxID=2742202 RepID=A0A927JE22_9ACTN|nr:DUF2252 domain-containing protein [Lolliginicoccus lacisalsi]MBD8507638.1 DUF2252 domain-containing protein [Lolliginicoccus lacisalsi]
MDARTQRTLFADADHAWLSADEARELGRSLREAVPFDAHAELTLSPARPTVAEHIERTNKGRVEDLIPIRIGRMSETPFTFYRGIAGLMAHDLQIAPVTGLHAQLCGDAHAANFGLFAGRLGGIIMDVNDFDETIPGPWEWDLKRLAASLVLAGRDNDIDRKSATKAARHASRAYRRTMHRLADLTFLASWRTQPDDTAVSEVKAKHLEDDLEDAREKAQRNANRRVADKWTAQDGDRWRFTEDPPIRAHVTDEVEEQVIEALREYIATVPAAPRTLLRRYRPHDVVHRIVGTGSVGLRSYLVLLEGNAGEALVLQVKQATASQLEPYVPHSAPAHHGQRVAEGAKLVQADHDVTLGWTNIDDQHYYVRQFRNHKADIDPETLTSKNLDDYGRLTGALLARAHARTTDPRALSAYLRKGKHFDKAIAAFANAYANQMEDDYSEFTGLIDAGELPILRDV